MINKLNLAINGKWIQILVKCNTFHVGYIRIIENSNKKIKCISNYSNGKKILKTYSLRDQKSNVEVINKKSSENNFLINLAHDVNQDPSYHNTDVIKRSGWEYW